MKQLYCCLAALLPAFLSAQETNDTNSIEQPKYDTTSIEINSTNSFSFCSKLYKIPRDCDKRNQSNCCSFSTQVFVHHKAPTTGQLGCYDGTTLFWTDYESEDEAKMSFEGYPPQLRNQMNDFKQTKIKLFICNQEVTACQLSASTDRGYRVHEILAYGNVNGHHVVVHLHSDKVLKSSSEMVPIFQQILQF